jgi:hypothetical protein
MTSIAELMSIPVRVHAAVDNNDLDAFAAILARDIVCEIRANNGEPRIIKGREGMLKLAAGSAVKHFAGGVDVVSHDERNAKVRSSCLHVVFGESGLHVKGLAHYEDDLIVEDGCWRIRNRVVQMVG